MDSSFSLQYNPLQKVRTVKDYESEIDSLKNEVFALKHQLSHYKSNPSSNPEVHNLLFDAQKSIKILENEKNLLCKQINEQATINRDVVNQKNEVDKCIKAYVDKINLLEEENNRLIKHVENMSNNYAKLLNENRNMEKMSNDITTMNKYVEELKNMIVKKDDEISELSKNDNNLSGELRTIKSVLENTEKERKQLEFELQSKSNTINELRVEHQETKKNIQFRDSQLENLRKMLSEKETQILKLGGLKNEYDALKRQYADSEAHVVNLQRLCSEYENANMSNSEKVSQLESISKEHAMMRKELENKENQISHLKKLLDDQADRFKKTIAEREESIINSQKHTENMYIKELQDSYTKETYQKQEIAMENERLRREINHLNGKIESLLKTIDVRENELKAVNYKVHSDSFKELVNARKQLEYKLELKEKHIKRLASRLEEYNKKLEKRVIGLCNAVDTIYENVNKIDSNLVRIRQGYVLSSILTPENRKFLKLLHIKNLTVNNLISKFNTVHDRLCNKISVLEQESKEIGSFAANNKNLLHRQTLELLEKFTNEFNDERKDLENCKSYLEKKGRENKDLKTERIKNEKRMKKLLNEIRRCRASESNAKRLYNNLIGEIKRKDQVISSLEMRIGTRI